VGRTETATQQGLDRSTGGVLFGGDAGFGDNWRLGVLGGYSHTSFDSDETASTGSAKNIHLGLYGGAEWGNIALRTGAAYTWHDVETQRAVAFPGFADRLSAGYDAGAAQAFGELGYRMETGSFRFEPFAGLAYVNLRTDGFTETGGASALTSTASTTDTAFTTLGLHAETDFSLGSLDATSRGTIGWRHAFGDVTPAASLAFAGGSAFEVEGLPIARDALLLEAGLDTAVTNAASIGLSYAGQVASKAQDHSFKANLTVKF
jgi:outer membrane autotransporter protein